MSSLFKRWTLAGKHDDAPEGSRGDNQEEQEQQQQQAATGAEWICIEEPVGFFFPAMKKQRQLLELDQVRHVLHYANRKRVMRIHDISLVTSVEETRADGSREWWMTVQDPRMLQVWIVHFPSLLKLRLWVDLLRSVVRATGSRAFVSDVVLASELDRRHSVATGSAPATCAKQETRGAATGPETHHHDDDAGHCEIAIFVP